MGFGAVRGWIVVSCSFFVTMEDKKTGPPGLNRMYALKGPPGLNTWATKYEKYEKKHVLEQVVVNVFVFGNACRTCSRKNI